MATLRTCAPRSQLTPIVLVPPENVENLKTVLRQVRLEIHLLQWRAPRPENQKHRHGPGSSRQPEQNRRSRTRTFAAAEVELLLSRPGGAARGLRGRRPGWRYRRGAAWSWSSAAVRTCVRLNLFQPCSDGVINRMEFKDGMLIWCVRVRSECG